MAISHKPCGIYAAVQRGLFTKRAHCAKCGSDLPHGLKVFLLTLAILDDLGAIVIIALFYTADLSVHSLMVASAAILALAFLNWWRVTAARWLSSMLL